MTTTKVLTVKVAWDPENMCDLADWYTAGDEESDLSAFKLGPLVLLWGREDWSE